MENADMEATIKANSEAVERLTNLLENNGYEQLKKNVDRILEVIDGNPKKDLVGMRQKVNEVWSAYERLRWIILGAAIGLGVNILGTYMIYLQLQKMAGG